MVIQDITEYPCTIDETAMSLVDMPGFDDTDIPDATTFTNTAEQLQTSYTEHRKFNGILYLHKTHDRRMKKMAMFCEICGDSFYSNVVLITTFWSSLPTTKELTDYKDL